MIPNYRAELRELLTANPDGLGTIVIADSVNKNPRAVYKALKRMPDTYIDRWAEPKRGQYVAVWCVLKVPADCPKPRKRLPIGTIWRKI
jgi:hypothetical protein